MSLRTMSLRTCILLAGVLWTSSSPGLAAADDSWDTKWSSRVRAYGTSSGAVGIYRALSPSWDLGLQAQVSIDQDDSEQTGSRTDDRERNSLAVSVFPELRKRNQSSQELFTYWGVQGIYEYRRTQSIWNSESSGANRETWSTGVGVAATFGATVRLHRHLGVSADLAPMSVRYKWEKTEKTNVRDDIPERIEDNGTWFDFDLTLNPSLYVIVFF